MSMNCVTLNGTGAVAKIGLGSSPVDFWEFRNLESGNQERIKGDFNDRSSEQEEGIKLADDNTQDHVTSLTHGNGIVPYDGGDVADGTTSYLVPDPAPDKRASNTSSSPITKWVLDTLANRTGHVNYGVNTDEVGEGSVIVIDEDVSGKRVRAKIVAMTADGDEADNLTLDKAVQAGVVQFIGPMYDLVAAPAGTQMPAGVQINETGAANVSGEMAKLIYGWYDGPQVP